MPRWEYLTVEIASFGFNNDQYAARYTNGMELKDWKKTSLHNFISRPGMDGWEMTGVLSPDSGGAAFHNYLFFKRPRP